MKTFVLAAALAALATPALAQPPTMVKHNGSLMALFTDSSGGVRIEYAEPKPYLLSIGVRRGTLLFDGVWRGNTLVGNARVYNLVCGPVPYRVEGGFEDGTLVLRGPQLRVNQYCKPYYTEWTENSVLAFNQFGPTPAFGPVAPPPPVVVAPPPAPPPAPVVVVPPAPPPIAPVVVAPVVVPPVIVTPVVVPAPAPVIIVAPPPAVAQPAPVIAQPQPVPPVVQAPPTAPAPLPPPVETPPVGETPELTPPAYAPAPTEAFAYAPD
jgi:hypothetical protein